VRVERRASVQAPCRPDSCAAEWSCGKDRSFGCRLQRGGGGAPPLGRSTRSNSTRPLARSRIGAPMSPPAPNWKRIPSESSASGSRGRGHPCLISPGLSRSHLRPRRCSLCSRSLSASSRRHHARPASYKRSRNNI